MQGKANGWDEKEIDYLQSEIEKCIAESKPLSKAFANTAQHTDRNQSSVRNFYYTFLREEMLKRNINSIKRRESLDFESFTEDEIEYLVKYIIVGTSKGKSIRQCANELAKGNTRLILRYQNKYRSVLKRHRDIVKKVLDSLDNEKFEYISPYKSEHTKAEKTYELLKSEIDLSSFISQINVLYDNGILDGNARKNLIYTKAMAEGEYNKIQKSKMLYEFYMEKLNKLINENIKLDANKTT